MYVCLYAFQVRMNSAVRCLLLPPYHSSSAFIFCSSTQLSLLSALPSFNTFCYFTVLLSALRPFPLYSIAHFSPPLRLAVLLLLHALFYLPPMCVIPSPLLPSNNSVQISVRHWLPKCSIYKDKHKINTRQAQTRHTGSSADLPMTLAHALQPSSVLAGLKRQKNGIFEHLVSAETKEVCKKRK